MLWLRSSADAGNVQRMRQIPQIKAAIEAISDLSKITISVFLKVKRIISATQASFYIPHDFVQPLEDWHLLRLSPPMISATCSQPASAVARKQPKPPEKTALPGTTLFLVQVLIASLVNPLTRFILM